MRKLLIVCLFFVAALGCKPAVSAEREEGLVLPTLSGGTWNFANQLKTKPILVTFMATYCGYCKEMAPYIDELAKKYKDRDVEIVAVVMAGGEKEVMEFVNSHSLKNVKVLYDGEEFAQVVGLESFPQMYLFDDRSDEVGLWRGYDPDYVKEISAKIDELLARPDRSVEESPSDNA